MTNASQGPTLSSEFAGKGSFHNLPALCPHCGAYVVFQAVNVADVGESWLLIDGYRIIAILIGQCPGCNGLVVGICTAGDRRLIWPPSLPPDRSPPDLDPEYKVVYNQARQVFSISPMAAAVLTRRCLQHVIRTKLGITKANLFEEIVEAVKSDNLTKATRDALDHIREIGNWGAHPIQDQANQIIEVTPEEAEYTLHVLELLFHDLYVTPARIAEMDAKVRGKKGGT